MSSTTPSSDSGPANQEAIQPAAPQAGAADGAPAAAANGGRQPNSSLTNAEISARSTKHAAWVAAAAAMLAALLAFGGSVWSAHTAAKNVRTQLSGETEKSRAEFLRGQRQTLYTKIIVDETALKQAESETYRYLIFSNPKARPQWTATIDLIAAFKADNRASVEIMASEYFRSCFLKLIENHENARITLAEFVFEPSTKGSNGIRTAAARKAEAGIS